MQVQILGLREYFNPQKKKTSLATKFFDKQWRADSVPSLFENLHKHLELIPEAERFNLFYTVAQCDPNKERVLGFQDIIPVDIDGIDVERIAETVDVCLDALNLDRAHTGIVFSGHGIHLLVQIADGWDTESYFEKWRLHYKTWIARANIALQAAGLPGTADPSVFSPARILRLPGTQNRKPGMDPKNCTAINTEIKPITWDWEARAGLPQLSAKDQIAPQQLKKFPTPDTKAVLTGCEFIKHCKGSPQKVTEPQWYALISVLANAFGNKKQDQLKQGRELCHEYSKGHPAYSEHETNQKVDQALATAGPRTCANINTLWDGCKNCPHFGTGLVSPITIVSDTYIKTKDTGFRHMKQDANGNPLPGKVSYSDLVKYFAQQHEFLVDPSNNVCYIFNGKYWEEIFDLSIKAFAREHVNPFDSSQIAAEFLNMIMLERHAGPDWFNQSTEGKINLQNGVLDMETLELHAHSKEYGFRYVLPYSYEPGATAPRFQQFLDEVTLRDTEMQQTLMEFVGYALSGDDCWLQKAMVLEGEGSNGKSVFLDVLRELGGSANYSSLTLYDMKNEANRYQLEHKLFNVAEETPVDALRDSSTFKNIVAGGEILVKRLYKQTYSMKNRAKLIFACNELPRTLDNTHALFRRFVICPFEATFDAKTADPGIRKKLYTELPGILNMALQGYRSLRRRGHILETDRMRSRVEDYKISTDTVRRWVLDHTSVVPGEKAYITLAYQNYKFNTEQDGEKPVGKQAFVNKVLSMTGLPKEKDKAWFINGLELNKVVVGEKEDF